VTGLFQGRGDAPHPDSPIVIVSADQRNVHPFTIKKSFQI
jgi:hypothetical protein